MTPEEAQQLKQPDTIVHAPSRTTWEILNADRIAEAGEPFTTIFLLQCREDGRMIMRVDTDLEYFTKQGASHGITSC